MNTFTNGQSAESKWFGEGPSLNGTCLSFSFPSTTVASRLEEQPEEPRMILRATGLQGLGQNNACWTLQGYYMPKLPTAVLLCTRHAHYLVSQDTSVGGVSPYELLTVDGCWRIESQFSLRRCPMVSWPWPSRWPHICASSGHIDLCSPNWTQWESW